ncbi:MAG: pyrroline-5-carboxylate reductase [Rikenellaceae bacterium]|nr:pyrroline-5-carboxylate reductase [Rikenellaceae bacterium]
MKIAIIGAGNMGGALARGLAKGTIIPTADIYVANPSTAKLEALKEELPDINITTDNCEAAASADMVVLAVKPWKVEGVLGEIRPHLDYSRQSVASMVGGLGLAQLTEWLDRGDGVVPATYLIIPNTAIATISSMTFIASARSTEVQDCVLLDIFGELGEAMLVEEGQIAAGTSLASCGIAYALRYVRAAMEGGVELGFRADDAKRIVMQTLRGAVDVLAANDTHPEAEIDRVTTPGGLTIKGLNAMEAAGFSHSVIEGLRASTKR